jgi:hypothetical protein
VNDLADILAELADAGIDVQIAYIAENRQWCLTMYGDRTMGTLDEIHDMLAFYVQTIQ